MLQTELRAPSHNANLLLVDENREAGEEIAGWLREYGFHVTWALSPDEAVQLMRDLFFIGACPYGMLIHSGRSDSKMIQIIQEFRHELPNSPVALMTTKDNIALSIWARVKRVQILHKPLRFDELALWLAHTPVLSDDNYDR